MVSLHPFRAWVPPFTVSASETPGTPSLKYPVEPEGVAEAELIWALGFYFPNGDVGEAWLRHPSRVIRSFLGKRFTDAPKRVSIL